MATGVHVKIEPETMASVASTIEQNQASLSNYYEAILKVGLSLQDEWRGSSASLFMDKLKLLDDDAKKIINILKENVSDLNETSGIFKDAEGKAVTVSEGLPVDGVFMI